NERNDYTRETNGSAHERRCTLCCCSAGRGNCGYRNGTYASLYFCCAIDPEDNELLTLEVIHRYVELLDKYFGSKAYFMLDELLLGGEVQETSKKNVLKAIAAQDLLQEE
ncbi:AP1S2-like protein, partial [Mya arenaria]